MSSWPNGTEDVEFALLKCHETPTTEFMDSSAPLRPPAPLVEHFFRHESGRLVAVLSGVFGLKHLDLVEEMVQESLLQALRTWRTGVPDNPAAWMHAVAANKVRDALRRQNIASKAASEWVGRHHRRGDPTRGESPIDDLFLDTQIADSQLRMIFACCHPRLSPENQIALTLKTLCGFSLGEISHALLISEETARKRLYRARQELQEHGVPLEVPPASELAARLDVVHHVLYLLFNEGYSATAGERPIRADLCEEAARLCHLLCCHERCRAPATFALLALMLFHAARLNARLDGHGGVLLLEDQDRGRWDRRMIAKAREYLDRSAEHDRISPYHLEAGIGMLHCMAESFADTDWPAILRLYDMLLRVQRSPVYLLNRAIVVAQIEGPQAGIAALAEIRDDPQLARYHLLDATLGELYRRAGDTASARRFLQSAREKTSLSSDHALIDRRLAMCD